VHDTSIPELSLQRAHSVQYFSRSGIRNIEILETIVYDYYDVKWPVYMKYDCLLQINVMILFIHYLFFKLCHFENSYSSTLNYVFDIFG
jgi:hypothetical protein